MHVRHACCLVPVAHHALPRRCVYECVYISVCFSVCVFAGCLLYDMPVMRAKEVCDPWPLTQAKLLNVPT